MQGVMGKNIQGEGFRFYGQSSLKMQQLESSSIALTVTSPPYWNAIDYDTHARHGDTEWYRGREYKAFGETFDDYLSNITRVFKEVLRVTLNGGFCAIVVGTILQRGKHYPAPMLITERMLRVGWEFHQDIIWKGLIYLG